MFFGRIAFYTLIAAALLAPAGARLVHADMFSQADDIRVAAPEEKSVMNKWRVNTDIGGQWLDGNTDNEMVSLGLAAGLSIDQENEVFLDVEGVYSDFNDTVVLDKQKASLLYAYKAAPKWNVFYFTTHAHNRFLSLDYRMTHAAGLCRHGLLPGWERALVSLALLDEREWWADDVSESKLRAALSLNCRKKISEHAYVAFEADYFPSLNEFSDYRAYGELYLELKVTEERVAFRVSLSQEYDSKPREGIRKSDIAVMPSLSFKFGG